MRTRAGSRIEHLSHRHHIVLFLGVILVKPRCAEMGPVRLSTWDRNESSGGPFRRPEETRW